MSQSKHCVSNVQKFSHALWFSVHTAATIGYGHQSPDPDCVGVNVAIMCQVLTSLFMQAGLLGLVFARFASPSRMGATIKFSDNMVNYEDSNGYRCIAFRIANLRHHQLLQPKITLLVVKKSPMREIPDGVEYRYHSLHTTHISGREGIWLGLPSIMTHTIDESSALWGMTEKDLDEAEAEFVVLLDGIDEMTSTAMQARHSYSVCEILWDRRFTEIIKRGASGVLAADYSQISSTRDTLSEHPASGVDVPTSERDVGLHQVGFNV